MSQNLQDELIEEIKYWYSKGVQVVPCHLDMKDNKKKLSLNGKGWKNHIALEESLERAKVLSDKCNAIAIKCGQASNTFVLDVDVGKSKNGFRTLELFDIEIPEDTPCYETQSDGGMQYLFSFPVELKDKSTSADVIEKSSGIDIRGNGGLAFVPPSQVEGGGEYKWIVKEGILRPPPKNLTDLILSRMEEQNIQTEESYTSNTDVQSLTYEDKKNLINKVFYSAEADIGKRSDADFHLCSWAKEKGLSKEQTWELAKDFGKFKERGKKYFDLTWNNAPNSNKGIINKSYVCLPSDFKQSTFDLHREGYDRGLTTGWRSLSEHYTVKPSQLTIVTGIPGHGKSEVLDGLFMNLAINHNYKMAIYSPENYPPTEHIRKLAEKYIAKPFFGMHEKMSKEDISKAIDFLDKHFVFINPDQEINLDNLLKTFEYTKKKYNVNGMLIDPWNEVAHDKKELNQVEYISESLSRIRLFAKRNNVHFWIVAHPQKLYRHDGDYPVPTPYDISGTAVWYDKADNILCVWRNPKEANSPTQIHIQKIRFKSVGKIGMVELNYDYDTGIYSV